MHILQTERLLLRPLRLSDLATLHAYAGDPENARMMVYLPTASLEETEAMLREAVREWQSDAPARLEFAMLREGEHIGGMTLYFLDDRTQGELGWIVRRDAWGQGYAVEAARALIAYAQAQWGMCRIIAQCDAENLASRRVMEKLGMRETGLPGTRKNRASDEERLELTYELLLDAQDTPSA